MRRACWTADFAEANIVAGLLRANGIDASVFDAGMAQLNWMQTLAIGGYRIMVADADAPAARDLLVAYRDDELELPDEDVDRPAYPDCDACGNGKQRNPRGVVFFLAWLGFGDFLLASLFYAFVKFVPMTFTVVPQLFFIFCILLVSAVFVLLLRWIKQRHRCPSRAGPWQDRIDEFATLSHAVDAAENASADPR